MKQTPPVSWHSAKPEGTADWSRSKRGTLKGKYVKRNKGEYDWFYYLNDSPSLSQEQKGIPSSEQYLKTQQHTPQEVLVKDKKHIPNWRRQDAH